MAKTIFITGASRGFGKIWAETFLKRGDNVIATARNIEALKDLVEKYPNNILALKLDITKKDECFEAIATAQKHFGVIDILINNAGYGQIGAIEEITEQEARNQVETNIFGQLWIFQAIVPVMRKQQSGHILQVSSALGLVTVPTFGIYNATKWAIEGLTETLASEVSGFGIKVTLIEPNSYDTEFGGPSATTSKPMQEYDAVRNAFYATYDPETSGNPMATSDAILQVTDMENPPLRLILGKAGFPWIKYAYENRLATWEEFQSLSVSAHGK